MKKSRKFRINERFETSINQNKSDLIHAMINQDKNLEQKLFFDLGNYTREHNMNVIQYLSGFTNQITDEFNTSLQIKQTQRTNRRCYTSICRPNT